MTRVTMRLIPFLIVCYFVAYLDRVNVGFAALQMNKDLGLSSAAFGFGAGIFFIAYFFFEVPSNLLLDKFGARRWIARIMFTWGLLSIGMLFVKTPIEFYGMRFALGVAEAGFFPGIIYYLSRWFPARQRSRAISRFYIALPLSSVIMGSVAGALLHLQGQTTSIPLPTQKIICTSPLKKAPGRTEFQRGILSQGSDGQWTVRATGDQGSGILSSMSQANCFIILPTEQGNVAAGSLVDVQLLEGLV